VADKRKSILLRIPAELADALQHWAQDELRSVNAQIEYVLRDAVRKRTGRPPQDDDTNPEDESPPND
jgi:hypothetical protein